MQNLSYETVQENNAFNIYKIRNHSSPNYIITALFKVKKVNRTIVEQLHSYILMYNKEAIGLVLDISVIDSIAPDILEYNADMIKSLEKGSTMVKVAICAGTFTKLAFQALMKIKKPKVDTKVYDKEDAAINFALGNENTK